jgi:hypothetical protein
MRLSLVAAGVLANDGRLRSATYAKLLRQPEPRAVRERLVVPSICSCEVACAERSGVRHRKDALQPLDFSNGVIGVHASQSSSTRRERVKRKQHWSFLTDWCVASVSIELTRLAGAE